MAIASLGYVVAETCDIAAWRDFAAGILGLMETASPVPGGLAFRIDERPFRLLLLPGERDGFVAAGLECASAAIYAALLAKLRAAGVDVAEASPAEAKLRAAHGLARCADPDGNRVELYWGRQQDYQPFISPAGIKQFITGSMGMGHVVFPTSKLAASHAFFTGLLGLQDTDQVTVHLSPEPNDPGLTVRFLHAENPRHHTVALAEFPQPSGLVHMMLEAATIDDVGRAYDRALRAGAHISATLGRHANDGMISFYVRSPGGFDIEFGCDGWQVDWNNFVPTTSLVDSIWGHKWDFK
ncbi:MAG TPA: VOC family protein [Acetobacteraceae bacterium]|nr:VOC family protein [Acetobacteraceae bacterium]